MFHIDVRECTFRICYHLKATDVRVSIHCNSFQHKRHNNIYLHTYCTHNGNSNQNLPFSNQSRSLFSPEMVSCILFPMLNKAMRPFYDECTLVLTLNHSVNVVNSSLLDTEIYFRLK